MIVWSCLETFSPDEEDGGVVAHNVPVALLRVELHCKPTRVPGSKRYQDNVPLSLAPGSVGGSALSTNSGKPDGDRSLLPNLVIVSIRNRTSKIS